MVSRIVTAQREIAAAADGLFELIADPAMHPRWDGNDNLAEAAAGQRVHAVGDVFRMTISTGAVRENHIVEFTEGRLIAWRPAEPIDADHTLVTHTYDWTELTDEMRQVRARATTEDKLLGSIDRLAALGERAQ